MTNPVNSAQLSQAQDISESPGLTASSLAVTDVTTMLQASIISHRPVIQSPTTQQSGEIPSNFHDPIAATATPTGSKAKTSTLMMRR
jgi:hypothetical protein